MTTHNFTTRFLKNSVLMASSLLTGMAMANSPVGQWQTSDEKTGELKSMVIIFEQQGVIKAVLKKYFAKMQTLPQSATSAAMIAKTNLWSV